MASSLLKLIDKNFQFHAYCVPAQTDGMQVYPMESLLYVDSGLSCDTFNIIHIHDGRTLSKTQLNTALNHFKERQLDYCIWINEVNLAEAIKNGLGDFFQNPQGEEVGMILELADFSPINKDKQANVRRVGNAEELSDFAQVIARNWEPTDQNVLRYYQGTSAHYLLPTSQIALFTYYQDNQAVACIELFPSDENTLGIYGFATLKAFRGTGIGSALFTHALNYAKAKGYQRLILQATEAGIGIYQRYGFQAQVRYFEFG